MFEETIHHVRSVARFASIALFAIPALSGCRSTQPKGDDPRGAKELIRNADARHQPKVHANTQEIASPNSGKPDLSSSSPHNSSSAPEDDLEGGWTQSNNNPKSQEIAEFVIEKLIADSDLAGDSAPDKTLAFSSQVVAGVKFDIQFITVGGTTISAIVFESLNGELELISSSQR